MGHGPYFGTSGPALMSTWGTQIGLSQLSSMIVGDLFSYYSSIIRATATDTTNVHPHP